MSEKDGQVTRRNAVAWLLRAGAGAFVAAFAAKAASRPAGDRKVWQINPRKCIQCGKCETACVLQPSAVKCVHGFVMCGYCKLCFGYFKPDAARLDEAAENQTCPTGAIRRVFVGSLLRVPHRRAAVYRVRVVRERLHQLRQRVPVSPGAPRPLRELQHLPYRRGVPRAGLCAGALLAAVSAERETGLAKKRVVTVTRKERCRNP